MGQIKWFERKFDFDNTQNIFPSIVERLLGTALRLEEKVKSIQDTIQDTGLIERVDYKWSIKENIGHLIDLEPLWQGRFEDIKNGHTTLRPTDLQNNKTHLANHNRKHIAELLHEFSHIRRRTLDLIGHIDEETIFKSALHPRLKTPMRVMDLFLFVAEHDDHHLARITEITQNITPKSTD